MLKVLLTIFFFGIITITVGQSNLPTIQATKDSVDFRVGDDYFAKSGWVLEPKKNPDIFSIGSKWPYANKRVTFITDLDSISFNVHPGSQFEFIILKENTPCHIRVVALSDPVLLKPGTLISLLLGFSFFILLLYISRKRITATQLLPFGYWVTILFWTMTFISGYVHGDYNHFKNTISELGAIGTKSELFTSCSLLLLALLNILFCIGFFKASKTRKIALIPAILSFAMPVSMIWAAIFTLGNEFHSMIGGVPFLIIIAIILSLLLWNGKNGLSGARTVSLIAFAIMILVLLRFVKPFGREFEGLIQRFFYLGWTIWTVGITYCLSRKKEV
jgi:hypothetical membrane protein